MSALHLNPEDRPGARRVLAHLQRLLRESSGDPSPTPYQSTLQFLVGDLRAALRSHPSEECSASRVVRPRQGLQGDASIQQSAAAADALLRLELELLRILRDHRRRLDG